MRILVVCLGNICRSPTAEAALKEALAEAGLADRVQVGSAGTGDWHLGEPPDPRMTRAAAELGLTLDTTSCLITARDFRDADLILVMDRQNLTDVLALAPDEAAREKVRLYRDFDPEPGDGQVPDPYYGGEEGFRLVVDMARRTARGVVDHVRTVLAT